MFFEDGTIDSCVNQSAYFDVNNILYKFHSVWQNPIAGNNMIMRTAAASSGCCCYLFLRCSK